MRLAAAILLVASGPLWAFDWGGSIESSTAGLLTDSASQGSLAEVASAKVWATWSFSGDASLLARANITDSFSQGYGPIKTLTNTVSADLDYLVYNSGPLWIGRTDFRDFSATLLNTKLDGVQMIWSVPGWDLKALVGTSAALFKSGSTIFISEDDVKDRGVLENFSDPSTLMAPPRVIGDIELSAGRWVTDQVFTLALAGQFDARPNEAQDGEKANTNRGQRNGASVQTAYLGAGGQGRVAGPLYWRAFAYACGGTSLTPVGPIITANPGGSGSGDVSEATGGGTGGPKSQVQYQMWKSSYILSGMGSFDLTLLMPEWNFLLLDLGVDVGSWDDDGPSPDQNQPVRPESHTPSLYTGWVQISQTAGILIFNPQPVNMVTTQLSASIKPWDSVQFLLNTYAFIRPSAAGISESGVDGKSTQRFLGWESDLAVFWRPASDIGTSLAFGLFDPNSGAMTRSWETKLQATISASF